MTQVRCMSRQGCPHRAEDRSCTCTVLVLVGFDAHCSVAQETRLHEHEAMLESVRERTAGGVEVLDTWREKDPDRDDDGEG